MNDHASGSVVLSHEVGLHARPSVLLTKVAKRFAARTEIGLSDDGPWIDAKSIARVMKMKVPKDSLLFFRAEGSDAAAALTALLDLVERDFQER